MNMVMTLQNGLSLPIKLFLMLKMLKLQLLKMTMNQVIHVRQVLHVKQDVDRNPRPLEGRDPAAAVDGHLR